MKTGLPIMLGIAWAPIIWMLLIAILGPPLFSLTGSWLVTQGANLLIALIATVLLLKLFIRLGAEFYKNNQ